MRKRAEKRYFRRKNFFGVMQFALQRKNNNVYVSVHTYMGAYEGISITKIPTST